MRDTFSSINGKLAQKMHKTRFEMLSVNYHESNFEEISLHSMGSPSFCDCCNSDPFGAGFREEIHYWLSIMVEGSPCSNH